MKKMILVLTSYFLWSSSALAGGFISGGGGISRGAWNPWFFETAGEITYCIERDAQYFQVSEERLDQLILEARSYWEKEFTAWEDGPVMDSQSFPRVANNPFVKRDCGQDVDLHFAFGVIPEKLDKEIDDPKEFIGLALRTAYDKEQLRGKGIIYIAPTSGPNKPNLSSMHPRAWVEMDNIILKFALIHEMGHVYGIQDLPSQSSMMWSGLLEGITNAETVDGLVMEGYPLQPMSFFGFGENQKAFGFCHAKSSSSSKSSAADSSTTWRSPLEIYFGITESRYCIEVERQKNVLLIYKSVSNGDPSMRRLLGRAQVNFQKEWSSSQDVVNVYLHPEQKIAAHFNEIGPSITLVRRQRLQYFGMYTAVGATDSKPIFGSVTPEGHVIFGGMVGTTIYPDLGNGELFESAAQ